MDLSGVFIAVEKQMQAELEAVRYALQHPGLKGIVNEEAVKRFLRQHIPDNLSVETGIVVDSNGGASKQIDIIIFDKAKTPVLFFAGGVRVIPVECVYAIIEVKTSLDRAALEQCIRNMESVKSLLRIAYYEPGVIAHHKKMYGMDLPDWQTIYFVFAYESMPANSIIEQLEEYSKTVPINMRIDSIYSLEHGLITNANGEALDALPTPGSNIVWVKEHALLLFYGLISRYLNQAHIRNFSFTHYLRGLDFPIVKRV